MQLYETHTWNQCEAASKLTKQATKSGNLNQIFLIIVSSWWIPSAPVCLVLCELTWRKLADVVADTDQHAGCFQVVSSLHMDLQKTQKKERKTTFTVLTTRSERSQLPKCFCVRRAAAGGKWRSRQATVVADLDQQVGVEDHQISGHLSGDFNLLRLQLRVHAEQHIMSVAVVSCRGETSRTEGGCTISSFCVRVRRLMFCWEIFINTATLRASDFVNKY